MERDRLEALLWKRVDGMLEDGERTELETALASHEARELERQVEACAEHLESLERVPPPAELRPRIEHAIAMSGSATVAAPNRWRAPLLALAAGLVLGVVSSQLLMIDRSLTSAVDPAHASGAMVPITDRPPVVMGLTPDIGRLVARFDDPFLQLDLETDRPVTLSVLGSDRPSVVASRHVAAGSGRIEVGAAGITLTTDDGGLWTVTLELPATAWPIRIELSSDQQQVLARTLTRRDLGQEP